MSMVGKDKRIPPAEFIRQKKVGTSWQVRRGRKLRNHWFVDRAAEYSVFPYCASLMFSGYGPVLLAEKCVHVHFAPGTNARGVVGTMHPPVLGGNATPSRVGSTWKKITIIIIPKSNNYKLNNIKELK